MAEPESMIVPMLRDMRTEIKRLSDDMGRQFKHVDQRFDKVESRLENVRQAGIGESVLGRYAAAEVEERLEQIEKRLSALEGKKPPRSRRTK
jgi:polyhydroxyalkanoate synthesis regulator phasin